jgi:hypothetical protein
MGLRRQQGALSQDMSDAPHPGGNEGGRNRRNYKYGHNHDSQRI